MRENKTCPHQGWQQMPTEELDKILQAELEKEHPNEEVVLPILHELEEREKNLTVEKTPEVLEIMEKLSRHETSSKQSIHKRRWLAGIASVAAAACIVVMALPRTVGAESILDVLFRWTSSVFEFVDPDRSESYPNADSDFVTEHPGLQQLYSKVTQMGVTEPVVPMWLPDGFELTELKMSPAPGGDKVYARIGDGRQLITISYRISTSITARFEKEDSAVEVYDYADISHFILENDDNLSVMWTIDGVECSILTDIEKDNVYKIIKSIYRGSLE